MYTNISNYPSPNSETNRIKKKYVVCDTFYMNYYYYRFLVPINVHYVRARLCKYYEHHKNL